VTTPRELHHVSVPAQRPASAVEHRLWRRSGERRWQRRYASVVTSSDLAVITLCVAVGVALGSGLGTRAILVARLGSGLTAWLLLVFGLYLCRAWEPRILGTGTAEFRRVTKAFAGAAVVTGLAGLAFDVVSVKPWVFGIMPAAWASCLVFRYGLRKVLHRHRGRGRCQLDVLAVGSTEGITDLVRRTRRDPFFGWNVAAVCTTTGTEGAIEGAPVVGDLDAVARLVGEGGYHVVAVSPAPGWGPGRLQQLAWELENTPVELAVDPGLMEIAGPRLHITPVDGLPLLRLTEPRFSGTGWLAKGLVDRLCAAAFLLLLSPVFVALAIAVRLDGGPAFYRQERVGLYGRRFRMFKFRSMCVGADRMLDGLTSDRDGVLFKMRKDPRVTRVGAFLRKYSLDELPQLFNVLAGSMSLVGPRPPLPREVEKYGPAAQRRLLVRPGITGLWQVSGRSDLSWEETVRLDLRYVENWSPALDALILWKTVGAVTASRGAY
jgi:exopolysaccharide biosynthesis polyprenyl glycosylphosphotransferase